MDDTPLANRDNGPDLAEAEGMLPVRGGDGRFLPGNPGGPGNPQARNVSVWRKALADSVSPDDLAQAIQKLIDSAKEGKAWAIRELLDRCLGKPHVQVELQADVDSIRQYSEREQLEGRRLARLLIAEAQDEA